MNWHKVARGSWIADGNKGRYQILNKGRNAWDLYEPNGTRTPCDKLRAAKSLAEVRDAWNT